VKARRILVTLGLAALAAGAWFGADRLLVDRTPIVVGILHSETGPMAVSERPMIESEILALEEINAQGGLLGRPVRWVVADGASDWPTFAKQAERLIRDEGACAVFGCWTSASRKSVLPVFEKLDHLLVYPMAYEGMEQSPNLVYVGASANQQVVPAVQWCHEQLKARRFFLVGSNYIWPRCVNAIATDQVLGLGGEVVEEAYLAFGSVEVDVLVRRIAEARPDVILSSVVGDSAIAFARGMRAAGLDPSTMPTVTFAVGENELQAMQPGDMAGDYAAWSYFQSIAGPRNREFVDAFRARYGTDRAVGDVNESAWMGVHMWAQAVREAGTTDVRQVRSAMRRQSMDAPEGVVAIDPESQHAWRTACIGRIRPDRQVDVVWTTGIPIRPVPFPATRTRAAWESFVDELQRGWGGRWTGPTADDVAEARRKAAAP
jgi:urea transport system substrate-binding protein